MSERRSSQCANCGHIVEQSDGPCPKCNSECWETRIDFEDTVFSYDETDTTITNEDGDIISERVQKTDLNTSANTSSNVGQPAKISAERKTRLDGFEEEGILAGELVKFYNNAHGTDYIVEEKAEEDNDYADRILVSETNKPRINIQIRHLDTEAVARLGRDGEFNGERRSNDLIAYINEAIIAKANIDPSIKSQTILQLILPVPVGKIIRQGITDIPFNHMGFEEIWISPFHEESFQLLNCRLNCVESDQFGSFELNK